MLNKLKDFQLMLLGIFLAAGVIVGALIVTDNISKDNVTVTGSAYEIVKSDSANWSFEVSVKNHEKLTAFKELKRIQPIVTKYLQDRGIELSQIDIPPVNSYEIYKTTPNGNVTNEVELYSYSQTFKVTSNDVEKIKNLSTSISDLAEQGINISSYNPEYQYSQMAELKIKLLEVATKDAKKRAEAMLKANRNSVGKIRSVKMGVFQITPPNSNSVSDYGINDLSTIDKKVTAVANVVFAIK